MDRRDLLDHVRYLIGVGDHYFFSLLASQIGKFLQHLLCSPQIQRSLVIRVGKAVSGHNDPAVDLVLGIHKMYVAGSHYGLLELFAQPYDFFIEFYQIFF